MSAAARSARRLGLGVVGCGGAALDVAAGIAAAPDARLVAVHDRDLERAARLAAPHAARIHATFRDLLADPAVDAVYVALPHDRLAPMSLAALRAGRHILVEKPLAIRVGSISAVCRAAVSSGLAVGVVFEHRHRAAAVEARRLVASGALGRLRMIRIRTLIDKPAGYWSSGPTGLVEDPWRASRRRAGGGVVMMNAIPQLDLVRFVTGRDPERVAALATAGVPGVEVEDAAAAVLEYGDGLIGSLVASAHAPGATAGETIEIDGDAGAIRLGDPYAADARLELFLRRPAADRPAGLWIDVAPPAVDPWRATIDTFVEAIRAGTTPVPGLDEAEAALRAVLAIDRAARTGRVVSVRERRPTASRRSVPPAATISKGGR